MTKRPNPFWFKILLLTVMAAAVLVSVRRIPHDDDGGKRVSTHFQWHRLQDWRVGWKRVAYCSQQSAAFRGWQGNLGPLEVLRLESTFTNRPNAVHQALELETNHTVAAESLR